MPRAPVPLVPPLPLHHPLLWYRFLCRSVRVSQSDNCHHLSFPLSFLAFSPTHPACTFVYAALPIELDHFASRVMIVQELCVCSFSDVLKKAKQQRLQRAAAALDNSSSARSNGEREVYNSTTSSISSTSQSSSSPSSSSGDDGSSRSDDGARSSTVRSLTRAQWLHAAMQVRVYAMRCVATIMTAT